MHGNMADLFDGEDSNSEGELRINKGYATNYNDWRQKEELNKLKTKYGEHLSELNSDDEDSSSSSEDEDANCLTEKCEDGFLAALSHLEKKDPIIYDDKVDFFAEVRNADDNDSDKIENSTKKSKKEKTQPLYLRDYERKIITERDGKFSDSEEEEAQRIEKEKEPITVPYVVEQRRILESIKEGAKVVDDGDDIFKVKQKSDEQMEEENDEEFFEEKSEEVENNKRKKSKTAYTDWMNAEMSSDEKFLRDYVFNNKFLDKDGAIEDVLDNDDCHQAEEIFSEDERNIEENQEFEHKYNYRYEEPDQEFIKRYPRTMENTLRKKDTRRAEKRSEVKKRKEEEKVRKQEELKQLKALKRKEIIDKIQQLKEITGNDDMRLDTIDLEGDFDPTEHDRKMQELFNDQYYEADEDVKPVFPELDEELGIESTWDTYDPDTEKIATTSNDYATAPHCEDADFNMDADYNANKSLQDELVGASKKKRRRRTKFAEVLAKEKPKFDPKEHVSFKDYIDQYYALDYEDMIGDQPCRFKYRKVVPNDYGLSVEEILMADDKELNKWCSLKKALEHKPEYKEMSELRMYQQKARNEAYKRKILQSLYKPEEDTNNEEMAELTAIAPTNGENSAVEDDKKKKRKPKKKKKKNMAVDPETATKTSEIVNGEKKSETSGESVVSKKEKQKLKRPVTMDQQIGQTDNQNEANTSGIQTKRRKTSEITEVTGENTKKVNGQTEKPLSKKQKRKAMFQKRQQNAKKQTENNPVALLSDERLKAYKINPRKFKNKLKYGKKD